ncbi:MAG: phosphoglucosamine mutase [Campylobacterales bacterium]
MKLFGTDGVRGEAGKKLSALMALKLGAAAGIHFRKNSITNKILVGKDTRRSGYMIENALVSGLTAVGYNVIQIGPMPTPAIAFLTENMRCDAGIMISASHNPFEDNGIKFFDHSGFKLNLKSEEEIEEIFFNDERIESEQKRGVEIGSSKRIDDVIGRYIVHIKNSFPNELTLQGLRIVIDAANGAAYKVAPTIFKELGADIFVINDEPNGYNINENCGAMDSYNLQEAVKTYRADIGFALDGDADRLVVVDENSQVVDGDNLIGVLALHLSREKQLKNNKIVSTVMSNKALEDFLKTHNIELLRSSVGDKNVFELMQQNRLNFGGEQSGHLIFSDYSKTGDGLVSALQCVALMLKSGKKASEVLRPFSLYPQKMINIEINNKPPLEKIDGLQERLEIIEKAGFRHLLRYSGTENKLRVLLEGRDQKKLDTHLEELCTFLKQAI